ncbi:uncharacterized protein LOC126914076 [Bombus affinis]|uniref:uncharacterized protein LOC126914076 n=1 Tax=Bombus affinis TaxID=309941 RepID=UPI0021B783F6|nr:uncharacterized protein LOC126914076 [Bombus affinis]XP_050573511.1 uncharacterized protein LOC126914076 [Bombus affinis]
MTQKGVERFLSVLYISGVVTSMTSMICIAILWQYWALILNACISIDCGCILYSKNTFGTFAGGDGKFCKFGVYGLVPTALLDLCLAVYHGYRSCIKKEINIPIRTYNDDSRDFNIIEPSRVEIRTRQRISSYQKWMPFVCLAILLSCLSLSHAIIITDGFYKTCDHYRVMLIQVLGSTGREAELIHNRLSCGAIFDFLDYLRPNDTWSRDKLPNSGIVFLLAIFSTWYNFISWMVASMLYYFMLHNETFYIYTVWKIHYENCSMKRINRLYDTCVPSFFNTFL